MSCLRILGLAAAVVLGSSPLLTAAPGKGGGANRKDEARENERVDRARKSVREAEEQVQDRQKGAAAAAKELEAARSEFRRLGTVLKKLREELQDRAEREGGLPALLAERAKSQETFDELARPIVARLKGSPEFTAAQADAARALAELQRVRGTAAANAATPDGGTVGQTLLKRTLRPAELEQAAVDAVPAARDARRKMTELQTRVATLRKQVADAVAQAPEVLRAQKELEQAQGDVEKSERSATAAASDWKTRSPNCNGKNKTYPARSRPTGKIRTRGRSKRSAPVEAASRFSRLCAGEGKRNTSAGGSRRTGGFRDSMRYSGSHDFAA